MMLDSLTSNSNLNGAFDRFSSLSHSGNPMDPATNEVFQVNKYLSELQFSLDLSPSLNFAAPSFKAADLYDALFPTNIPTIQSFVSFVKRELVAKISVSLGGLFDAGVNLPLAGLSLPEGETPRLGVDGINIGVYTQLNNKLFPPKVDIDALKVRTF